MFDLQAVYIRDSAKIENTDLVSMVRVNGVDTAGITEVTVNGQVALHIRLSDEQLLVSLPSGMLFGQVHEVKASREVTDADGTKYTFSEIIGVEQGLAGTVSNITETAAVLKIVGEDFTKAARVLINRRDVPYAVVDSTKIYAALPENDRYIESVNVISTSKTITRTSFFEYMVGDELRSVAGIHKVVSQLIKVLLTTPGSNAFDPGEGGDLQNWVGQRLPGNNPQALIVKTVLNISLIGAKFQVAQAALNLPPEERLTSIQVVHVGFNEQDPSAVDLTLQITTAARQATEFSMLVGVVEEKIRGLVKNSPIAGLLPEGI